MSIYWYSGLVACEFSRIVVDSIGSVIVASIAKAFWM